MASAKPSRSCHRRRRCSGVAATTGSAARSRSATAAASSSSGSLGAAASTIRAAGERSAGGSSTPRSAATRATPSASTSSTAWSDGSVARRCGHGVDGRRDVAEAEAGRDAVVEPGHEAEPRRRDHAERALTPGQEAGQVVARVVLGETGQVGHDAAVAEDRFDPHHLRSHRAVAHDVDAAGVGGHHPADGAGVPRREVDAEGQAVPVDVLLQAGQRHAGAGGHLGRGDVDRAQLRRGE